MLQIRSSNPRLIKISMYLYIKPVVKKMIKKTMTTAINEACIGEGNVFGVGNGHFFAAGRDSPPIYRVSPKCQVWEKGQASPCIVGATSKMKGGNAFLVRWGLQGV